MNSVPRVPSVAEYRRMGQAARAQAVALLTAEAKVTAARRAVVDRQYALALAQIAERAELTAHRAAVAVARDTAQHTSDIATLTFDGVDAGVAAVLAEARRLLPLIVDEHGDTPDAQRRRRDALQTDLPKTLPKPRRARRGHLYVVTAA